MYSVAIYAGAFNPIHSGHVEIINYLAHNYDKVEVIPNNYKRETFDKRCEMIKMYIKQFNNVTIDGIEGKFIDVVRYIGEKHQCCSLFVAMGADCIKDFKNWYKWNEILDMANLIVFKRPGYNDDLPTDFKYKLVEMNNESSSTEIRNRMNWMNVECCYVNDVNAVNAAFNHTKLYRD